MISANSAALLYLISGALFILALRGLSSHEGAQRGNLFGIVGMIIAVSTAVLQMSSSFGSFVLVVTAVAIGGSIGILVANRVAMTAMPQLVAFFHSLVGLSAIFVAASALYAPAAFHIDIPGTNAIAIGPLLEMSIGIIVGAITFSGSVIAFAKLNGNMAGKAILLPSRHIINIALACIVAILVILILFTADAFLFWSIVLLSLLLGVLIVIPIGGADMPVVVSMLNSYSGWAAASIGFTLGNISLIITGALVGASGGILSYIICKGMNRSFISVILGGFGEEEQSGSHSVTIDRPLRRGSAEDAAFIMGNSSKIIIVPGYGMAVAQAQHVVREMSEKLKSSGVEVKYAIHPVAGRMPGHMNVLLAEANVPYDEVFEIEDINNEFAQADAVYVIGANDITNPAAKTDPKSPIFGMPILDVESAKTVFFVKRSMGSGYSGVENELFFRDNTVMLFGDAKTITAAILKHLH